MQQYSALSIMLYGSLIGLLILVIAFVTNKYLGSKYTQSIDITSDVLDLGETQQLVSGTAEYSSFAVESLIAERLAEFSEAIRELRVATELNIQNASAFEILWIIPCQKQ